MRCLPPNSMVYPATVLLATVALFGCAINTPVAPKEPPTPVLMSALYGAWANANGNFFNWWEISAVGAVNYGIALDQGKCGARRATVLGTDRLEIPFGNAAIVHLSLGASDLLVFEGDRGRAVHKRVAPTDICRKPDGTYFEGAPHIAQTP